MRMSPIVCVQTHGTCGTGALYRPLGNIRGGVGLDFNSTGLACFMLIDLDRPDARAGSGQSIKRVSQQTAPAFDEITDVGGACGGKPALLHPAPDCARDVQ
jgi:hypothetical protein